MTDPEPIEPMESVVGRGIRLTGTLTTLNRIGPRPVRMIEASLGFTPGALSGGYHILLLKEPLRSSDYQTIGQDQPAGSVISPTRRPGSLDDIVADTGGRQRVIGAAAPRPAAVIAGPMRLAMVVPSDRKGGGRDPVQRRSGGGAETIDLKAAKGFLIAAHVRSDGTVETPYFTISLSEELPQEELAGNLNQISQYLAYA
ncbi:hypothetical protein [Fulvimarina sp. MAC3]|uniref:hypothetical protein n=1 Tax=Fulvimarina sp. MAC3 TaxID=3148887 RepID=UPI0031FBA3FF